VKQLKDKLDYYETLFNKIDDWAYTIFEQHEKEE
jgi:hypothetical protein